VLAFTLTARAEPPHLSPLGQPPVWSRLDAFNETTTYAICDTLLREVYLPPTGDTPYLRLTSANPADHQPPLLEVRIGPAAAELAYALPLAKSPATVKSPPRYWRPRSEIPPATDDTRPLGGVKIALDPGHLGANWARLEERWFVIGDAKPVMEGEMTLLVASLLAERLRGLGADVSFVRENGEPATSKRPADFLSTARETLAARGITDPPLTYTGPADSNRQNSVQWEAEHLFFRAEIQGRAKRVNETLQPDLVLCLHFNAEPWGDPAKPELVDKNHFHLLINGCYSPDEIANDDTRLEMLVKLLNGSHAEELAVAQPVAAAVAAATGLPPYEYTRPNAIRVGPSPYVWARNLLANRLFECPVLYLEPYVMKSPDVFARVQAGDYEGERVVNGIRRKSIFREYADAVAAGLTEYYRGR
jgi:N-acetylmuramoyl-L-alanine amidase